MIYRESTITWEPLPVCDTCSVRGCQCERIETYSRDLIHAERALEMAYANGAIDPADVDRRKGAAWHYVYTIARQWRDGRPRQFEGGAITVTPDEHGTTQTGSGRFTVTVKLT
jgi:hypothetical protein